MSRVFFLRLKWTSNPDGLPAECAEMPARCKETSDPAAPLPGVNWEETTPDGLLALKAPFAAAMDAYVASRNAADEAVRVARRTAGTDVLAGAAAQIARCDQIIAGAPTATTQQLRDALGDLALFVKRLTKRAVADLEGPVP